MEKDEKELAVGQRTGLVIKTGEAEKTTGDESTQSLSPSELKTRSERCKHYWEVERHCFQKLEDDIKKNQKKTADDNDSASVKATPSFLGVYQDDGNGNELENSETIQGYGLLGKEESSDNGWFSANNGNDGKSKGHEWMTFEFVGSTLHTESPTMSYDPAQTLLDAMEVSR